ncbi:NAD-dependent protein deacylase [Oceanobacillus sp. CAU 1775]
MLKKWIDDAKYTVVFTGAGMSTESGLPDFRSANKGLWKTKDPTKLASTEALNNNVDEFIAFYRERVLGVKEYGPHKGHEILAEWETSGKVKAIITQNVDGFHQEAGSKHVAELHGTLQKVHCESCGREFDSNEYVKEEFYCKCGGVLRPSIVLFGEGLPQDAFQLAIEATEKSDLFIVLGSSLTVSPANQFPMLAKENGAKLVIVNQEPTPLDMYADLVIQDKKIGEVLKEANN